MAKKILGDDPFSSEPRAEAEAAKTKSSTKAKRAPARKTEAPKATRAPAKTKAEATSQKKAAPSEPSVSKLAPAQVAAPEPVTESTRALSSAVALTRTEISADEAPQDAAPGSWRWWRFRQLQLARTEEQSASVLMRSGGTPVDRFGRDPNLVGRTAPVVDVLYRSWLRVSVRGLGHVPESGRAILVAKRRRAQAAGLVGLAYAPLARFGVDGAWSATLDAAVIAHAVRTEHVAHREVRPLVKPARLYTPLLGGLLRKLGGVPADLHDFARLLDDDRLALAFVDQGGVGQGSAPDTRPRADALDLSTIVCLALLTGAPIVPVQLASSTAHPRFLRPQRNTVLAFGTPLYPGAEFGPDGAEDEALVARLAGELAAQL